MFRRLAQKVHSLLPTKGSKHGSEHAELEQLELQLRESVHRARRLGAGDPHYSVAAVDLGRFLSDWERNGEAIALYKGLLDELEGASKTKGAAWVEVASALTASWIETGEYSKAEPLLEKVLQVREALFGQHSPEVLESLHNKAALLQLQGQLHEAEELYREVLSGRERLLRADHPATATTRSNLGQLFIARGEWALAREHLERAVEAFRDGRDFPADALAAFLNLADLHSHLEEWDRAAAWVKRALALARKRLGERHPKVGEALSMLAAIEQSRGGDLERAERLYRDALEIQESVKGGSAKELADTLEGLGAVLYKLGRPGREKEVCEILERSVEVRGSVSGPQNPEHAPALSRLAWLYGATGDDHRAEQTWKKVLGLLRPVAEMDGERWGDALDGYAAWLESKGRQEEAQDIREEAARARGLACNGPS